MKKSEQFASVIQRMFFCVGNQEILKDEAIQQCGESMMEFVMTNSQELLRGLKMFESCESPSPELLDLVVKRAQETWDKERKNDPEYALLMPHVRKIGYTVAMSMFGSLWEISEEKPC